MKPPTGGGNDGVGVSANVECASSYEILGFICMLHSCTEKNIHSNSKQHAAKILDCLFVCSKTHPDGRLFCERQHPGAFSRPCESPALTGW